jgi:hypothetical protein
MQYVLVYKNEGRSQVPQGNVQYGLLHLPERFVHIARSIHGASVQSRHPRFVQERVDEEKYRVPHLQENNAGRGVAENV